MGLGLAQILTFRSGGQVVITNSLMLPWNSSLHVCLWDLDGTLINSYPAITASVNHVRAHFALEPMTVDAVRYCVGHGVNHLMTKTAPGCDLAIAKEVYAEHHQRTLTSGTVLLPGAADILRQLKVLGVRHAVCSNKPRGFSEQLLDYLGLANSVDVLLGPEDVKAPKPAPDMLLLGLDRLGATPDIALFVGDMAVDIQAARGAGLKVAVVATGSDSEENLKSANPDLLASGLPELGQILGLKRLAG